MEKKTKKKLFRTEDEQMDKIINDKKIILGSKQTCERINNYFLNKVNIISKNISKPNEKCNE
jgi:hypothetical protein